MTVLQLILVIVFILLAFRLYVKWNSRDDPSLFDVFNIFYVAIGVIYILYLIIQSGVLDYKIF